MVLRDYEAVTIGSRKCIEEGNDEVIFVYLPGGDSTLL
jgi:hypothetical protein